MSKYVRNLNVPPPPVKPSISWAETAKRFQWRVNPSGPLPDQSKPYYKRLGRCHEWTGGIGGSGYGSFAIGCRPVSAHRAAWMIAHGGEQIPWGMFVLHRCDNSKCVNPAHLFLGTHEENMADMVAKNRVKQAGGKPCIPMSPADRAKLDAAKLRKKAEYAAKLAREIARHDARRALKADMETNPGNYI